MQKWPSTIKTALSFAWFFDRDACRSGPTIHFVNLFPLLLIWVFSTQMSNNWFESYIMFLFGIFWSCLVRLDQIGPGWTRLDQTGPDWTRLDQIVGPDWIRWLEDDLGISRSTLDTLAACYIYNVQGQNKVWPHIRDNIWSWSKESTQWVLLGSSLSCNFEKHRLDKVFCPFPKKSLA